MAPREIYTMFVFSSIYINSKYSVISHFMSIIFQLFWYLIPINIQRVFPHSLPQQLDHLYCKIRHHLISLWPR